MAFLRIRRSTRRKYLRAAVTALVILFLYDFCSLLASFSRPVSPGSTYEQPDTGSSLSRPERIFIASTHWNNELILRESWNDAVIHLVKSLGPPNVFVSIVEGGSWDNTKGALRELKSALDAIDTPSEIILEEQTHAQAIAQAPAAAGWIDSPRGRRELRRIPFLSNIRNKALEPMFIPGALETDQRYDKILFLNDVVFTKDDARKLLATRNGDYAAACSIDYKDASGFYDTFALRDSNRDPVVSRSFPFFRSALSRKAVLAMEPVPVTSCWNGMVAFSAMPFYDNSTNNPLRFRAIPDSLAAYHLEGSECCLIHADNPLVATNGIWLNPSVRVGYNSDAYAVVHPSSSSADGPWLSAVGYLRGVWANRLGRWTTSTWLYDRRILKRVRQWEESSEKRWVEPGTWCLIDEMQVIVENGWKHL